MRATSTGFGKFSASCRRGLLARERGRVRRGEEGAEVTHIVTCISLRSAPDDVVDAVEVDLADLSRSFVLPAESL